jgi:AraC-like DNA-binding protein
MGADTVTDSEFGYYIPSSYSRIIARELGLQERELGTLLRSTGLHTDILMPGDESRITGRQQLQILYNAQLMKDAEDFGLRLGRQLRPSSHGPLGYLVLSSEDLLKALEALRDFLPMRIPFVQLKVELTGDWLRCGMTLKLAANSAEQRVQQEGFAMVIQSIVEAVIGSELRTAQIKLRHPRPSYHKKYADYLHSKVVFSAEENAYLIPATLAYFPNASGDAESYSQAHAICQQLLEQAPTSDLSTADRVRRYLLSQPMGTVTEEQLARAMFITKRTLARRLENEGTGYRALRDQLLSELAVRQLLEPGLTVEAIAASLGYNDSAALRKAFRRWHGCSPSEYRDLKR